METKLTTWQEQGLFSSLVKMQGEEGTTVCHNVSVQERKAPKAMPEEDLEAPEPGTKVEAPWERQTIRIIEMVDALKTKNQKFRDVAHCTLRDTQEAMAKLEGRPKKLSDAQEEPKKTDNFCEDNFPPPPPLSTLSAAEDGEKEGLSSLEGEEGEWISEAEPTEDIQERPKTPKPLEPARQDVDISSQLNSSTAMKAGDISANKMETCTSQSAQHCLSDMNSSDDRNTLNSPPFADESEEEEGTGGDLPTCQQQSDTRKLSCVGFQPSCSYPEETDADLPANGSVRQEEAVLPQSQSEPHPSGLNQEAPQQVFGQGSPPGSAVAMELTNQGGEAFQGHSCVAAVRESSSRVGERTEGENVQTGGVKGQNKSRVEKSKAAVRSQRGGLFRCLQAVQTQKLKAENSCGIPLKANGGTRMRTDMYDDSQRDSRVSTDFHSYRTLSSSTGMSADSPGPVSTETPIEREIRRAIAREQSLRRSRGLPNQQTSTEYVEIPLRKSLLSQSVTPKWSQNKDREFAGKKMQQEIHKETRREQDLVKIGKIPGYYDKGTVRQIKERKQLFETLRISPELPLTFSSKSKTPSWSSNSSEDLNLTLESRDESGASTPEHTYLERKPMTSNSSQSQISAKGLDHSNLRGSRFSEGTGCQIIILENSLTVPAQKHYKVKAEPIPAPETGKNSNSSDKARGNDQLIKKKKEQEEKEAAASKENPFFKLRSSANLDKVRQDVQEAKDREKELRTLRLNLYGGINGAELPSQKEIPGPGPLPNGICGSYEGKQSVDQVSARPPVQREEEKIFHPEIRKSPRTPRQKTPLVQLWESGLVNSYNLEEN